jgi:NAD(P)-dependent dehydrogenase (short-subunit alcohol dehydrogenase family)
MAAMGSVLITGAAGGIGSAIARRFAKGGVVVLAGGRDPERCEALVAELREAGASARAVVIDVKDAAAVRAAVAQALRQGPIDALVNNAGIAISAPLLSGETLDGRDLFEAHLEVNFHGARRVTEAVLPEMKRRKFGRIVNVASTAGLRGFAYASAYAASKHALLGYTRSAALELEGSGVAMSAVCPHYVDSPMTDRSTRRIMEKTGKTESDVRAFLASQNAGGRLITPDEVAEAVWSLASEGRNGWILELDGERTRRVEGVAK